MLLLLSAVIVFVAVSTDKDEDKAAPSAAFPIAAGCFRRKSGAKISSTTTASDMAAGQLQQVQHFIAHFVGQNFRH